MQIADLAPAPGPKEIVKQSTNLNTKQKKLTYGESAIQAWPAEGVPGVTFPSSTDT